MEERIRSLRTAGGNLEPVWMFPSASPAMAERRSEGPPSLR
uniref:Uncharacterized protein n=1 Tax=Arundo donax TaxID=35708 RepID=A0A0A9G0P6_ARUDO